MHERAARKATGLVAVLLCALTMADSVNAQEPSSRPWREQMEDAERPPTNDPPEPPRRWYGWQTLAIDLVSVALVITAGRTEDAALGWTGAGVWLVGAPVVHLANARGSTAAISFGIRAGAGLLFAFGGALFVPVFDDVPERSAVPPAIGFVMVLIGLAGSAAAVAIDAGHLAFEETRSDPQAVRVLPWVDPQRGRAGAWLSLPL